MPVVIEATREKSSSNGHGKVVRRGRGGCCTKVCVDGSRCSSGFVLGAGFGSLVSARASTSCERREEGRLGHTDQREARNATYM